MLTDDVLREIGKITKFSPKSQLHRFGLEQRSGFSDNKFPIGLFSENALSNSNNSLLYFI